MKGRLENMVIGMDGNTHITISTRTDYREQYDELKDSEVEVTIKKHYAKRSLDANAYMWELCTLIADKLMNEGTYTTKEDVYRETVKQVGIYRDIPMQAEYADTLRKAWEMHGIAWITEIVDYGKNNTILVRCYYGTSTYNRKQMTRVIDNLIQDCEALNIEHRTPEEINKMLSLWDSEPKEGKNGR